MNSTENHAMNTGSKEDGRRIDLQAAYRIMIRAYLRRRLRLPHQGEAKHG